MSLVDEGNIEGEEGVNVIVGSGGRDGAGILSAEGAVGASFLDWDDQVGEESGFGGRSAGSKLAGGGGDALVDSDCGRSVWGRWWVDCDGGDSSSGGWWRGRVDGDGASGNEWLLRDADVVLADSLPWVATIAVSIAVAANLWRRWWRRGNSGCGGCGDVFADAHIVDADSVEGVAAGAILIRHAADGWHGWS